MDLKPEPSLLGAGGLPKGAINLGDEADEGVSGGCTGEHAASGALLRGLDCRPFPLSCSSTPCGKAGHARVPVESVAVPI